MFSSKARLLRFRPADGMQVVVRGRVTVYEDRGELQIAAEYIEPKRRGRVAGCVRATEGEAGGRRIVCGGEEEAIPALPSRIGIVTSPQAAALRDILNILQRRHHSAACGDLSGAGAGGCGGRRSGWRSAVFQ